MKLLVCGSRSWTNVALIEEHLVPLEPDLVIHGGAQGADRLAKAVAECWGFPVQGFPADWGRWGKSAGVRRNWEMLQEHPDRVLAFWDGKSVGTAHMVRIAQEAKIPVDIILDK